MHRIESILNTFKSAAHFPDKYFEIAKSFALQYISIVEKAQLDLVKHENLFLEMLKFAADQVKKPYKFPCYHQKVTHPYDYYTFGNEFMSPLIEKEHSKVEGTLVIEEIIQSLKSGHNVFLLSNHQTEADPQMLSLLLDDIYPDFVPNMIHIAGERVTTDPFAVPFSLGRNLLCIYSKKYLDHPPEKTLEKKEHNRKAMVDLTELLKEGGHCFWVAPSGGRDRKGDDGEFKPSPYDPKSIEMFRLLNKKAGSKTLFYPLSLLTYPTLPPPESVQKELGEARKVQRHPVYLYFDKRINFEELSPQKDLSKAEKRDAIADAIWGVVNKNYQKLLQYKKDYS